MTTQTPQAKPPLQLLPSALSTHREIWTHGLLTPPSGSPLYSEGDLSWDTVTERLQQKEKSREQQEGSNLPPQHKSSTHNVTAPLEHDVQNRWLADLICGKLERSWRSNSNGSLTTYQPVQQANHHPLHSTSSTQQLSHHAFEFVPSQNKRFSAPVGDTTIPLYADIGTPPPHSKWGDYGSSPMEHGDTSMQHKRRRRSHSGSPLSSSSSTSSMSLDSQQDSSPPMRRKRRSVQCKFFLQGKCAKGEACPFSHAAPQTAASPSSRRNTKARVACKYITSGKECPFGENCLFNHNVNLVPH